MIELNFCISNPWSNAKWHSYRCWYGSTPFKNKFWEVQTMRVRDIIKFAFLVRMRCDHPGVNLELSLIGFNITFNLYDNRHFEES